MAIVEVRDLTVTYAAKDRTVAALQGVSLDIEERDAVGIVGESGSGKSTLAMAILRLLPKGAAKVSGEVRLNGTELLTLPEEKLAKLRWKELAVVFQKSMSALSPVHKIGHQLADVYRLHERASGRRDAKRRVMELLAMVNLPARAYGLYPHELSGGMMQRVAIALSLMHHPKLLILDEATTALDVVTQGQILDEIVRLEQKLGITRIMITHDMAVVAASCNKVAVMYAGKIVESGDVKDVLNDPVHPYTQGLLRSIPTFAGEKRNIRGIPGSATPPDPSAEGCGFAGRCEYAAEICSRRRPPEISLPNGRRAACHLAGGGLHA